YVDFLSPAVQATWLVNARLAAGADWGRLFAEARVRWWLAPAGTLAEAFFQVILDELCRRG
ncbi:hypothetical protein QBC44DRAFT_225121, partial [Cladorrhinum sp. PSN332]